MKNKIANVLISLIKGECPSDKYFPIDEKILLKIALKNKAVPLLFHFINYPNCQQKLRKKTLEKLKSQQKSNLVFNLLYENKKRWLNRILKQKKIKVVFLKDFSSYQKMKHHQLYMGLDIDILINKDNLEKAKSFFLKEGYLVTKGLPYEITFANSKSPIEIDLHFLICEPHKNEFKFFGEKIIKQVSQEFLDNSHLDREGYYRPSKEYFLLSLIMHYWTNDVLKGLRNLFEIIELVNLYNKQINWQNFLKLAGRFELKNLSLFILLLGSQTFSLPIPQELKKLIKIPLRVSYPLPYYSVEKIALFPKNGDWGRTKEGQEILKEHFFLQAIVNEKVSYLRLIRPQIIFFLLKLSLHR